MEVFQRPWLSSGPTKTEPTLPVSVMETFNSETSGSSYPASGTGHEYEYRDRLRTWLVKMIHSGDVPGLKWLNEEKTVFRMPWKHAGRQDYNLEDSKIFMEWAKHSGRYREGVDKPEPIVWKTRLRCALNKMPDIRELPEMSRLDISDPYRVYELLPAVHKVGAGNDDKIRRRVYKRSANGSEEHLAVESGPSSPKMSRTESSSEFISTPLNNNRPFYPVFNHPSPNGGSTGTQSQESDSNSTGNDDRNSPLMQKYQHAPQTAQRPISYPIPLPVSHNPTPNFSPSSFVLALVNCNPLVMADPMLSSSLATLATQILHMEHMMQANLNNSKSAKSEVNQLRDDVRELSNQLHSARAEKSQLEQTLLLKVCNSQPEHLLKHVEDLEKNVHIMRSIAKVRKQPVIDTEFENSRLMELLPLDQKLQILNERLQATRNELRHERVQRQQIEQESTQLKASIDIMQIRLKQDGGLEHLRLQHNHIQGMESPPSSRHSESESSESERRDSVDTEDVNVH